MTINPDLDFDATLPPIWRERGIASLTFKDKVFRFRTSPNKIRWTYTPLIRVDPTYGGRVIQLLGARIEDLVVEVDSGLGGIEYQRSLLRFCRNVMVEQRDQTPTVFEYTSRQWKLSGYLVSVPVSDDMSNVLRTIELSFKVQEDISGIVSQSSLSMELLRLQDGVGWHRSQYNQPTFSETQDGEHGFLLPQGITGQDLLNSLSGVIDTGGLLGSLAAAIPGLM